jgi:hypothetical protein
MIVYCNAVTGKQQGLKILQFERLIDPRDHI